MMKRIVLTGAECTGKSTLARALSEHFREPWTGEYVREYVETIGRELCREDLPPIATGQIATEDAGLAKATRFVLHDTNLLSSIIYAEHYFNAQIDWVDEAFHQRNYTLYLLCTPRGIDWQDDPGQRDSPAARATLQVKFKESLDRLQSPYIELSGDSTARLHAAVKAIDQLI